MIKAYQANPKPALPSGGRKGSPVLLNGQYEYGGWPQFFPIPKDTKTTLTTTARWSVPSTSQEGCRGKTGL
ncbi:MAG: hypothetical protein IPK21_13750 [Haliscomenobacter sp.]|nr:hypothetical protein [Haliscomenobacter sp.]